MVQHRNTVLREILSRGVVAVVRAKQSERLIEAAQAINDGGVNCIEVSLTTPNAFEVMEEVSKNLPEDVILGAGTVLDSETARRAILSGAEYLVSPTSKSELLKLGHRYGKVVIPGAFTPNEILDAYEQGADLVKVFPAGIPGPKYLRAIKAPLPQIPLIPTGGVNQENAGDFIRAGASAVCVGSALINQEALKKRDFESMRKNASKLVKAVQKGRDN